MQATPQPEGSTGESAKAAPTQNPWVASMRSNWQEAQKELSSVRDDLGRYLKNEWEDFMRFVEVLKVAWGQMKEVWNDTVVSGGGMKERQRRREAREKEHEAAAAARLQRSTEEIQQILASIKKARSEAAQAHAQGAMEQGKQENEEVTSTGSAAAAAEVEQREASGPAAESAPAPAPTPAPKPDPARRPSAGRRNPMKRHQRRAAPGAQQHPRSDHTPSTQCIHHTPLFTHPPNTMHHTMNSTMHHPFAACPAVSPLLRPHMTPSLCCCLICFPRSRLDPSPSSLPCPDCCERGERQALLSQDCPGVSEGGEAED